MFKTITKVFIFLCVSFFLLVLAAQAKSAMDRQKKNETFKELELFADALAYVQVDYVDEVKPKDLIYGAIAGMLNSLDPHSQFLTPEEYEDLKADTQGKFGGIGIEITIKDDLITIVTPIEGTPAWDAGLQSNDRIVKIDEMVIKNFTLSEVVKKLRGKPGTEVNLVVWREKESRLHSVKIKREMIDIKDIKEAKILEDHIAYLRLVEFRENTPLELDRVLNELKTQGADSVILDLRNNPGGLLDKAVEVAERFLPKDGLIVSIKGREVKQNADFKSKRRNPDLSTPLVILINEGSASGSEIVAGALRDHKRAVLIGTKTFGKASVQTVLPLKDGSALKLTTSRYFTPSGQLIHEKGIEPDILIEEKITEQSGLTDKDKNLEKIFEKVEESKPAVEEKQALDKLYATDNQLARAVDVLKGIKIYKKMVQP